MPNHAKSKVAELLVWLAIRPLVHAMTPDCSETLNGQLRSCQQAEAWETSIGVLGSFPGLRMHPDAVSWTAVITGLKPFWKLSSHLLHAAARRGATDSITFGAASLAFESDGLWTRSLALQTYNQQGGGLCDAVLVGSAASACDKGCAWADSLGLLTWASASRIRLKLSCMTKLCKSGCCRC